jgi:hypothetical protein
MLEKMIPSGKNMKRMKVDLYLEYQGALVLIAWARETSLGVYMGVRFSPEVENASYFKDGRRELLRFPMMPDGKRKREEVPLEGRSPIPAIRQAEPILARWVNVAGDALSSSPTQKPSAGTTAITIPVGHSGEYPRLYYDAYIVHNEYAEEFLAEKKRDLVFESDEPCSSIRLFSLDYFPEHCLALRIRHKEPTQRSVNGMSGDVPVS